MAESLGLKQAGGVIISSVAPDSAADHAGLMRGDVLLSLNGQAIHDMNALRNRVADTEPGYYKFGILFSPKLGGSGTRERFLEAAQAEGVSIDAGFRGFAGRGEGRCRAVGDLALAQRAANQMMVLHHPVLLQQPDAVDGVAHALWKVASAMQ